MEHNDCFRLAEGKDGDMKNHSDLIACFDKTYQFKELFNLATGFYLRTGILKRDPETGQERDTGVDPFMRSMASLVDIGIMGTCIHGRRGLCLRSGVQCYQDGQRMRQENMSLENFTRIIDQIRGKAFQCALGGRGDPNKHEHFEAILAYCRKNRIVPNYTTSGLDLTDEEAEITKAYAGAVAVSFYKHDHTYQALDQFMKRGVKTNIHYVLSTHSIDEAIEILRCEGFPKGVNAIVFLLHKPVGSGKKENVLSPKDERVKTFFDVVQSGKFPFKIGFDSCSIPGILNHMGEIHRVSIDACEGGRFSCYISPDMKMTPCSFDQEMRYAVDLNTHTIAEAWEDL